MKKKRERQLVGSPSQALKRALPSNRLEAPYPELLGLSLAADYGTITLPAPTVLPMVFEEAGPEVVAAQPKFTIRWLPYSLSGGSK